PSTRVGAGSEAAPGSASVERPDPTVARSLRERKPPLAERAGYDGVCWLVGRPSPPSQVVLRSGCPLGNHPTAGPECDSRAKELRGRTAPFHEVDGGRPVPRREGTLRFPALFFSVFPDAVSRSPWLAMAWGKGGQRKGQGGAG